jgi:hypothetical protein
MRFSIKSKFLAAARVKQKRREKCDHDSNVSSIEHNHFQTDGSRREYTRQLHDFYLGELEAADFADQRIALPIACEISCRAWP